MPRLSVLPLVAAALVAGAPARSVGAAPAPAGDAAAPADDPGKEPPAPRRGAKPGRPMPPPPPPDWDDDDGWIDVGHAFVEQRLFAPILRLDRFFSDERDIEVERSRSFLRWRSEVRFSEETSRPVFTTGVRATLRLPGLNKQLRRLRVVIAGETRDAISTLFPRDPDDPASALAEDENDVGTGDAGLRFYIWETLTSHADLGGGILAQLPPGGYGRLRFRLAVPVRTLFLARSAVTGFYRTDTRFGTSAALDLERAITPRAVVRLGGGGTLTEVSRGVEWGSELALLTTFGMRSAAAWGVGMSGATDSPRRVERYRVYTRLRRDFYRRWLFLELEPELAFPWTVERGRHAAWGVAFRLEVQFRGNEAPRRPEPSGEEAPPEAPSAAPDASRGEESLPGAGAAG